MPIIKERLNLWTSQQITPTLRGLFYILVSLNVIENTKNRYTYLSKFTAEARENGENGFGYDRNGEIRQFKENQTLPIDCFADHVRHIINIDDIYVTPENFIDRGINHIKNISENYQVPRWYNQPHYIEVWVEKDSIAGTLDSIINIAGKREIRIVPTRGQESVTFAWENVKRIEDKQLEGKKIHILYFGDLDPSGEAIEREIINKLERRPYSLKDIDFRRIGVTNEQRERFNLIPNTDPETLSKLKRDKNRFAFMHKYNLKSENDLFQIEVDALEAIAPDEFKQLVLEEIDKLFDEEKYQEVLNNMPTESELSEIAINKTRDLLASLESDEEADE